MSSHLVDDADLLAVRGPLHVPHHGPVPVVDHLLEPDAAVQHPDLAKPPRPEPAAGGPVVEELSEGRGKMAHYYF